MQGVVPLAEQIVVRGGVELVDDDLPSVKARLYPRAHRGNPQRRQAERHAARRSATGYGTNVEPEKHAAPTQLSRTATAEAQAPSGR
jgi:hypothetical protein